jgi:hypothetical protein
MHEPLFSMVKAIDKSLNHSFMMIRYLSRLGYLGGQFGLKKFDKWAQSKLQKIFVTSTERLIKSKDEHCNVLTIMDLMNYMQTTNITDYRNEVLDRVRMVMCGLVVRAYDDPDQSKDLAAHAIIPTCVGLYKKKTPLINSPHIFGFVFAVVLSLGPHSPLWESELTREDRRVLYAANSILMRLCNHTDLRLGWLLDPTYIHEVVKDCDSCSKSPKVQSLWDRTLGKCNGLNSPYLLEDIHHIVRLPDYRQLFCDGFRTWHCSENCREKLLLYIDFHIDRVYCAFTKKYKHLEESVPRLFAFSPQLRY